MEQDKYLRTLNCYEEFNNSLPIFKEIFKMYYGEENSEHINNFFNNTLFIAYISPEAKKSIINSAINDISKKIGNKIISELGLNLELEDLFGYFDLRETNHKPIDYFKKFYEDFLKTKEERKEKFFNNGYKQLSKYLKDFSLEDYKELLNSQNPNYEGLPNWIVDTIEYYRDDSNIEKELIDNFNKCKDLLDKVFQGANIETIFNHVEQMKQLYKLYEEGLDEYNKYISKFQKYIDEIEKTNERKYFLKDKYLNKFIKENIELFPQKDRKEIESYIVSENTDSFDIKLARHYFGFSIETEPALFSFSSEFESKLNDEKISSWVKESIINDRIEYFKLHGIDLGNDYNAYLNSEAAKEIWPEKEKIDLLIEKRKDILNDYNIEFYGNEEDYKKIREEIEKCNFLDKDYSFNPSLYTFNINTMVSPNIVKEQENYHLKNMLLVNMDNYDDGYIDHFICHELNHLYELVLTGANNEEYSFISGWDNDTAQLNIESREVDTIHENTKKRPYELINEIINELIAQDISKMMDDYGIHIFDEKDKAKYKGTTSYENTLFLIKDFYNEFKDTIIKSRKNGQINILFDEVGKENFDELNNLFNIFYEHFGREKIFKLKSALENNINDELVQIYNMLKEKRDEILDKMREYKTNKISNSI